MAEITEAQARRNVVPMIHPRTMRGFVSLFLAMTQQQQDRLWRIVQRAAAEGGKK